MISVNNISSDNNRLWKNIFIVMLFLLNVPTASPTLGDSYGRLTDPLSTEQIRPIAELDKIIQASAFEGSRIRKTGIKYNVALPSSLAGMRVEAVRLRSGSLRRRGFVFNEFRIPSGSVLSPSPRWIAMIYRDFGGLTIYGAPEGYIFASPVVGIKVYQFPFNYSASETTLPELNLDSGFTPTSFQIPYLSLDQRTIPYCAAFDKQGRVDLTNVSLPPNICSSTHLGDFSLVIPSPVLSPESVPSELAPSPALSISFGPSAGSPLGVNPTSLPKTEGSIVSTGARALTAWRLYVAIAAGGILLVAAVSAILVTAMNQAKRSKFSQMEYRADVSEMLQTALIDETTRAPAAGSIRTRPTLIDASAA